ncbi:MAG: efflux RND transporter periplasmic adaptor subunit [Bacteroidia bacterium]
MKIYHILMLGLLSFTSCDSSKTKEAEGELETVSGSIIKLSEEQKRLAGIKLSSPQLRQISETLQLNGYLEAPPQNIISVTAPLGGFIKTTPLLQGMHIHTGDLLATVEDVAYVQLQEDFLTTREELNLARLEKERQTILIQGDASALKNSQIANSKVNQLLILEKGLSEKLRLCGINPEKLSPENLSRKIEIRSPANAFVKSVHMNMGKYVGPQEVLAELIDSDHLHVELTAYEQDIDKIKEGQRFQFHMVNSPEKTYEGHVYLVGKALSENRNVQVHGHLDDEESSFMPGKAVSALIELKNDSLMSIEASAVFIMNEKPYIFKQTNKNEYEMLEIEILKTSVDYIGFRRSDSLSDQSTIAIEGVQALKGMLFNTEEE